MPKWEKLSYIQGVNPPRPAWEIKLGKLLLTVVYGHVLYPNCWSASCPPLITGQIPLYGAETAEQAQRVALQGMQAAFEQMNKDLDEVLNENHS